MNLGHFACHNNLAIVGYERHESPEQGGHSFGGLEDDRCLRR